MGIVWLAGFVFATAGIVGIWSSTGLVGDWVAPVRVGCSVAYVGVGLFTCPITPWNRKKKRGS